VEHTSFYYPVDVSTTVFSYSHAVQYHTLLGQELCGILATKMCFNAFE